jgi:hypothetical protein
MFALFLGFGPAFLVNLIFEFLKLGFPGVFFTLGHREELKIEFLLLGKDALVCLSFNNRRNVESIPFVESVEEAKGNVVPSLFVDPYGMFGIEDEHTLGESAGNKVMLEVFEEEGLEFGA